MRNEALLFSSTMAVEGTVEDRDREPPRGGRAGGGVFERFSVGMGGWGREKIAVGVWEVTGEDGGEGWSLGGGAGQGREGAGGFHGLLVEAGMPETTASAIFFPNFFFVFVFVLLFFFIYIPPQNKTKQNKTIKKNKQERNQNKIQNEWNNNKQEQATQPQPRKIQFLRTFGVGPFFFFFGSNQRERYFSMEHGRWKVARRSLHQLPQPPPETFDDDNPQPPKINWSP